MKNFFVIVAMLLAVPCVQAAKCKVDGHWYDYSHQKCSGRSAPAPKSGPSGRSRSPTSAGSSNPVCPYSPGRVEADSKKHFKKKYPDSHATQNMLYKANMKDYRAVCGLEEPFPDTIRYQLIHRTASAVIEAERFNASRAVMLVHTFSPENRWFEDFAAFASLFGANAEIGRLATSTARNGLSLHLGWVHGEEKWLGS